jgi:tetratricopeptide (TPR) repeat protein
MSTAHALHPHAALFQEALAAHRQGRLDDARAGYLQVLQSRSGHAEALHMLGVVHLQRREPAEAEALIRRALALQEKAAFLANLGNALRGQRRLDEAESAFRRALLLDPDDAATHNNLGVLLKKSRRLDEAEAAYRRALELRPAYAEAHNNLGIRLKNHWRTRETGATRRDAAPSTPGHARALNDLGNRHQTNRRPAEAAAYRKAIDYWCFVLSLPLRFSVTADTIGEAPVPYVHALPARMARWQKRLPAAGRKVGLAWKGSPGHGNDGNRSSAWTPRSRTLPARWASPAGCCCRPSTRIGAGAWKEAAPPGIPACGCSGRRARRTGAR